MTYKPEDNTSRQFSEAHATNTISSSEELTHDQNDRFVRCVHVCVCVRKYNVIVLILLPAQQLVFPRASLGCNRRPPAEAHRRRQPAHPSHQHRQLARSASERICPGSR